MKAILVPTDFSDNAKNALLYAFQVARAYGSKVIIFNSYYLPSGHSGMLVSVDDLLKKESAQELKRLKKELENEPLAQGLELEFISKWGEPDFAISELAKEYDVDLVVMGTQGATNAAENILGSVTTATVSNTNAPLLVVPEGAAFSGMENIVFALDNDEIENQRGLNSIKKFAQKFNSRILLLHVYTDRSEEEIAEYKENAKKQLAAFLSDVDHAFYAINDEDVLESINDFVNQNDAEMLVVVARKRALFQRIFHKSVSKRLALHTKTPMFILHDKLK